MNTVRHVGPAGIVGREAVDGCDFRCVSHSQSARLGSARLHRFLERRFHAITSLRYPPGDYPHAEKMRKLALTVLLTLSDYGVGI